MDNEVCDEDSVGSLSYERFGEFEVWLDERFVERWVDLVLIPHRKHPSCIAILLQERFDGLIAILILPLLLRRRSFARVLNVVLDIVLQIPEDGLVRLGQV